MHLDDLIRVLRATRLQLSPKRALDGADDGTIADYRREVRALARAMGVPLEETKVGKDRDSIGDRFKRYENAYRIHLPHRLPMIVRVDGRAFHTFTAGMEKPWDPWMVSTMLNVAKALCEQISGCKLAYVQSDEISLLVRDDETLDAQPWFDKNLQKIVSVAAGIASATMAVATLSGERMRHGLPVFDARAFVLPPSDVCNYFVWRQQDAVRNSVSSLAHAKFDREHLHGLDSGAMQELLFREAGINWNDVPTHLKRGACVRRVAREVENLRIDGQPPVMRYPWEVDLEIPTFTQARDYVEGLMTSGE